MKLMDVNSTQIIHLHGIKEYFFANVSSIFLFDMNFFALAVFTLNAVISIGRALPNIDMVILCKNR